MYNVIFKMRNLWLLLFAIAIILSCKKDDDTVPNIDLPDHDRAEVKEITSLGVYSVDEVIEILNNEEINHQFYLDLDVEAFSVKYYSEDANGTDILVSGCMLIPQKRSPMALVSIQHGTLLKHDIAASISPEQTSEGLAGLLMAAMGYFTIVPDYPGFGESKQTHPYLHAASIVPSVVDLILVAQEYCEENDIILRDDVFLSGYSEGGYITLHTQKVIESDYSNQISLRGVAPMAGPYDLKGTFAKIFEDMEYCRPAYIAYWLTAYNDIYNWNKLGQFFQAPYAGMMNGLFDGSKTWAEVEDILDVPMTDLMHPDFVTKFVDDESSILWDAICENTCLDWTPKAPLHFFHGDCDNTVFCFNATNAYEKFLANGASDVELTIYEGANHETTGDEAALNVIDWICDFYPDF